MREHLLFVDTETSDLPKDWNAPYSQEGNWPFIVQIAWVIYTSDGEIVKTENHYISDCDYSIAHKSHRIHQIGKSLLGEKGEDRKKVMEELQKDLLHYNPLVVGHFMPLDFHMIGVGFYRSGIENPLLQLPTFCTMELTADFLRLGPQRGLKLGELYERLFHKRMINQHDALTDAQVTADCFFELRKLGDINDGVIKLQQIQLQHPPPAYFQGKWLGCILAIIVFLIITLIIYLI